MKKITLFAGLLLVASSAAIAELDQAAIENYQPDAKILESVKTAFDKRVTVTENERGAVNAMSDVIASREFQEKQAEYRKSIANSLGVNDWVGEGGEPEKRLPYSLRPIVFASASVPVATLRNYIADLEKVNGVMVFRGFVGGMSKVMPTMKYMDSLIKKNAKCSKEPCDRYKVPVLVDPILFKEYQVKAVPALAVHGLTNLAAYCNGTEGLNPSKYIVYGDSSIKYLAMKLFEKSGDSSHQELIERL